MHPADQMSTALLYDSDMRTISGARYQRVTTYSVRQPSDSGGLSARLVVKEDAKLLALELVDDPRRE